MKNALSFAVALGLVAGVATVASAAELTINGDARWRGVYMQNAGDATDHFDEAGQSLEDQGQDTWQEMDQRYRFNVNVKVNDDVTINTRLVLADDVFGDALVSEQDPDEDGTEYNGLTHKIDRANMVIKTLGGTWTIGRQEVSWGNKFMSWGESADRFKGLYKSGDITYGGFLQKHIEDDDSDNGDGDKDSWAGVFIMKVGETTFGILPVYTVSDAATTYNADGTEKIKKGASGYLIDPYITTKVGPATVMAEFVYQDGDLNENSGKDPIFGGFVGASMDLAPVTIKGLVAYWDGNEGSTEKRDCDNDFAPSVLIGTCNETAIIDFGETTHGPDDSTYLVGAGVDFKASDKLTLGGMVGYLMASEKASDTVGEEGLYNTEYNSATDNNLGGNDATMVELDFTAKYALAQNANYTFSIGYGMVDHFSAKDDDIIVVGNRIEVAW